MAGNSFGQAFRITTAGESHGPANVVIIDGCPPGIPLSVKDFEFEMARRQPGQSHIVTQRRESDEPKILSGTFEGLTTGTSIAILIENEDARGKDYKDIRDRYRPGHADFTYEAKYGVRDYRGGGRASARETTVRVAAGVVARKILARDFSCKIVGYVVQIGDVRAEVDDPSQVTLDQVEKLPDGSANLVRCPDPKTAGLMLARVEEVRRQQDSIGGVAEVCATGIPAGFGEPVFDKLRADLGKALLSIPAVVGVEFGMGFASAELRGSEHNDPFIHRNGETHTISNHHGGLLGGISSGMPIVLRAAVKPTSSIPKEQETVTASGQATTISTKGRHDPCLLPRFVPIAEAMVAITLADHWLRWRGQTGRR